MVSAAHCLLQFNVEKILLPEDFAVSLAGLCRTVTAGPRCHWFGIGDDPTAPGYIGDHPDPAVAFKGFERHPGALTPPLPH